MRRAAKLGRHNGYWYTKTGNLAGDYFGRHAPTTSEFVHYTICG